MVHLGPVVHLGLRACSKSRVYFAGVVHVGLSLTPSSRVPPRRMRTVMCIASSEGSRLALRGDCCPPSPTESLHGRGGRGPAVGAGQGQGGHSDLQWACDDV